MQTNDESVERVLDAVGTLVRVIRRQPVADLESGAYFTLCALLEGERRPTVLAQATHLDASTVSRHLDNLEARGYAERRPDPGDGRARLAALTPAGRAAVSDLKAARRRLIGDELSTWDPADIATLEALLSRLVTNVIASLGQEGPRA